MTTIGGGGGHHASLSLSRIAQWNEGYSIGGGQRLQQCRCSSICRRGQDNEDDIDNELEEKESKTT